MPYVWFFFRLAVVVYWAHAGWVGIPNSTPFPLQFFHIVFAVGVGALGARFWFVRPYLKSGRTEPWTPPSWFLSPLQPSQPFQFVHLCGASLVAMALFALLRGPASATEAASAFLPIEMLGGGLGLGLLIGVYGTMRAFRRRFRSQDATSA